METRNTDIELINQVEKLKAQLSEAQETLHAIRTGQVDAIVVENEKGHQLYKLHSADHTYRLFIEKMKEGAVTLNTDEIILYGNSQFASIVGLPLTKVIGKPMRDFIPQDYLPFFDTLINIGWASDSKGEITLTNKEGQPAPYLFSFTSLEMDDEKALSIILTDLSLQKEAEEVLKEKNRQLEEARLQANDMNVELEHMIRERTKDLFLSREHFRLLADNIPVIVWTARPDGRMDYFNKQWYEFTRLSFHDSANHSAELTLHPDDLEISLAAWQESLKTENRFQHEYRIKRYDGQYRWHLGKSDPLRDETGKLIAWFGTATDIEDQRKQMEKKDEFISVASHELKTPLTSLKGYLQLIEKQNGLSEEHKLYMDRVNASVIKLQSLINDLLDVSKIQSGKLEFKKWKLDLGELTHSCIENGSFMYRDRIFKKSISDGLWVDGNSERLEQVVMNLISNAVKYSSPGKEINISAEKTDTHVIVSVSDQGIGLSENDQVKIFERFYRVADNKFLASGLGMGLYISSEIIKEHNGKISVKSKLNEGSTFYFSLPVLAI